MGADAIRSHISHAFKLRFNCIESLHIQDWVVDFPSLNDVTAVSLKSPFFEKEIFQALMDTKGNKTTGPDGFPFKFA